MGHGRLDSILGSYSIPRINFLPHNPSKSTRSGFHNYAEINENGRNVGPLPAYTHNRILMSINTRTIHSLPFSYVSTVHHTRNSHSSSAFFKIIIRHAVVSRIAFFLSSGLISSTVSFLIIIRLVQ